VKPAVVRRVLAALTGLALTGGLAACGGQASGATAQSIVLYSGQHVQTTQALVAGFEKATGIAVSVRSDSEDTLADQIVAEGSRSPADVIYTEDTPVLEFLQEKGLLVRLRPSTLARVPSRFNSARQDWVGVSGRVSVLVYNPALITAAQLPTSVLQLSSPRYRGKLAMAPQEVDFQPIVTAVDRAYGRAAALRWLAGMKTNSGSRVYPDNETVADEVNRGTVAFGIVNQYYWYRMRAEIGAANTRARIAYFAAGNPGYEINVSGAAVLRSSRHQAAAQKFLAYLAGRQAQQIIGDPAKSISFEYPIGSDVTGQAGERPLSQLRPYPITPAELGDGTSAIALLRQAGLL
jgi:iron(III) transport system substrate-binding protein